MTITLRLLNACERTLAEAERDTSDPWGWPHPESYELARQVGVKLLRQRRARLLEDLKAEADRARRRAEEYAAEERAAARPKSLLDRLRAWWECL